MSIDGNVKLSEHVALLAEGVDRNGKESAAEMARTRSPSSRRAWIEMKKSIGAGGKDECRPPRGGRGYTLSLS